MTVGRRAELPVGSAVRLTYQQRGRQSAVLVIRRGEGVRAFEDVCPHQFLPLTYRGDRILSADGERLRCSSHGAEFAVEDGRCLSGPCNGAGLTQVAVRITAEGGLVIDDEPGPESAG